MSHRVTVQTEVKDVAMAQKALDNLGVRYRQSDKKFTLLSGDYSDTIIDCTTGVITSGDVDHNRIDHGKLGLLRQAYSEAKYRAEAFEKGILIQDREVVNVDGVKGVIKLKCRMA